MTDYDSTADTLKHSQRVGELMAQPIHELIDRSMCHDRSKTQDPELATFNEFTPKLRESTYGSGEYKGFLAAMKTGLDHHYAHNRHHPEHFENGIDDMTLVDLIEMLADWRAATERHADGSLTKSLVIQKERFGISDQLDTILWNTARRFGWFGEETGLTTPCDGTCDDDSPHDGHLAPGALAELGRGARDGLDGGGDG